MELGVCYYPEHWPTEQWPVDALRMREMNIRWVRIAEFAWSRLELNAGRFELDWLERAVAAAAEFGIETVIGTPSAAPPASKP